MPEQGSRWVLDRFLKTFDPCAGVQREVGLANLWFGAVPRTVPRGTVVACSCWVEEQQHVVRCDSLATLSLPV